MKRGRYWLGGCCIAILASQLPAAAQAREAPPAGGADEEGGKPAPGDHASSASDNDIIVTANRRDQRLIDVPLAVTAVSGDQLKESGVRDVRDLISLAPSLNAQTPGGDSDSSLRIRGIGTISTNIGLESSVGILIDGVVRARVGSALSELGDIERIEVLRGPQGTLYGANTSAGLVNIITAGPSETELTGYLEGAAGNYGYRRLSGALSSPLSDTVSGRIEFVTQSRRGFVREVNTEGDLNNQDRYLVRGRLRFRPTENLRFDLIADYSSRNENCCTSILYHTTAATAKVQTLAAARGLVGYPSANPFDRLQGLTPGRINQEDVRDGGVSLEGDLDLGWANLVSVTSYRKWKARRAQDFDHSGLPYAYIPTDGLKMALDQITQELRLQGQSGALDWLIGGYFSDQTIDQDFTYAMDAAYVDFNGGAAAFAPGVASIWSPGDYARAISRQKSQDYAVFTHNTLKLTDRLSFTAGLRYSINRKSVSLLSEADNPACDAAVALGDTRGITVFCSFFYDTRVNTSAGPATDKRKEDKLSGTAVASFSIADNLESYLSFSRGWKSGGYNLDRYGFTTPAAPKGSDLAFGDETTDAFEFGLKGEFLDRRFTANLAVFDQTIKGFQLIERDASLAFRVRRLEKVKSRGVELETAFRVTPNLRLQQSVAYTDTYYTDDPGNGAFAGRPMEQSPKWTTVSAISYNFPIGSSGLRGTAYIDGRYVSDQFTSGSTDRLRIQEGYALVNARLGLNGADGAWHVDIWARNLFDKEYARRILTSVTGNYGAFLGDPRTYGITLRYSF